MADALYTATCPAYTLGRFLGLAHIASDPELWRVPAEQIVADLVRIANEYQAKEHSHVNPAA